MNFDLSDEQHQLKDAADRFGRDNYDFTAWLGRASRGGGADTTLWREMAELGWLGLMIPEAEGGFGGTAVDAMVVLEAIGRWLMLEPYVGNAIIAPVLLPHLRRSDREEVAQAAASGATILSLADAEDEGRFDPSFVATRAVQTADGFLLTGGKAHALDGGAADLFVLAARTAGDHHDPEGVTLFLVPKDRPGLTVTPMRAMDHRINASLRLDGVALGADDVIGEVGAGLPLLSRALDAAVVARCAEALGVMDAAFAQALDYLKTRKQFGQFIGEFQVLQHKAVSMAIACEEARSMVYLATLALNAEEPTRRRSISAAKARIGQSGLYVARQAIQLHGGIGFSDELAIGHYLKRLTMIDLCYGNADHHRTRYAEASAGTGRASLLDIAEPLAPAAPTCVL